MRCSKLAAMLFVALNATAARAEMDAAFSFRPSEEATLRRLQQQGDYGQVEDVGYDAGAADNGGYAQAAAAAIPSVVTELQLGCSCSLHIPCFDLKTSACVPTICGSNNQANFVDNRIPRHSHPTYDDDGKATSVDYRSRALYNEAHGRALDAASGFAGPAYSNPLINGCKCPSGTTRCYQCAEIGKGTKIFMWVLVVLFLILSGCVSCLMFTADSAPTPHNQFVLAICGSMYCVFALTALAYMCIALDWGYIVRPWDLRRVYYVRYADWLISTMMMTFAACYIGYADLARTVLLLTLNAAMVVLGLIASLIESNVKWVFFVLAFLSYIGIAVILLVQIKGGPPQNVAVYVVLKWVLVVFFLLYPLVWLMSAGIGHFCASTEATLYGVLDLLTKMVFCGAVALTQSLFTIAPGTPPSGFIHPWGY